MKPCFLCGHSVSPKNNPAGLAVCSTCRQSLKGRMLYKAIRKRIKQIQAENDLIGRYDKIEIVENEITRLLRCIQRG